MTIARLPFIIAAGALAASFALTSEASAQRGGQGGGKMGDTFIDDAQKNPRFIEPGADHDPARYRIGSPREGFYDRQAAREGYYTQGSGYYPYPYGQRGRVYVQPYGR